MTHAHRGGHSSNSSTSSTTASSSITTTNNTAAANSTAATFGATTAHTTSRPNGRSGHRPPTSALATQALIEADANRLSPASPSPRQKTPITPVGSRPRLYNTPSSDPSLTPKERLNALLSSTSSGSTTPKPPSGYKPPATGGSWSAHEPALNESARPQPTMDVAARRPISPPVVNSISASAAQQAAARNSSMDSALSSLSSTSANASQPSTTTSHSVTSSQDTAVPKSQSSTTPTQTPAASPPNDVVATLITSAGSPEAAIQKLLRDAKKTTDKNDQLWKLVEKQRTMILGLNKDLERALKDKERYRRKYKDFVGSAAGTATPEPSRGHGHTDSIASSILTKSAASHAHAPSSATIASTSTTIDASHSPPRGNSKLSENTVISDVASAATNPLAASTSTTNSKDEDETTPKGTAEAIAVAAAPLSPRTPQQATHNKTTAVSSPGEKTRKAAPAPLNLSQAQATSPMFATQVVEPPQDDSESDYDGPRPEDFGRGRRRTREDDDSYREAVVIEEERRSRSNKSGKSKSKSKSKGKGTEEKQAETQPAPPPHNTAPAPAPAAAQPTQQRILPAGFGGLPTSPRAAMLGGLQSPLQASMGSIASQIQPPAEPQYARALPPHVALPAKSPGLPMSPRPGHAPLNSPMPRAPLNGLASPGPLSPRSGVGNPLSPRAPRQPISLPQNHALAAQAPHLARAAQYQDTSAQASSMAEMLQSRARQSDEKENLVSPSDEANVSTGQIFRGFVSDDFPKLLLPPNAIPLIEVKVHSSRLRPARQASTSSKTSEEDQIFTLAVHARTDGTQLWRVEKTLAAFGMLDQTLRSSGSLKGRTFDRSVFSGHSPAKIDARRAALNEYFDALLDSSMDDKSAEVLCHFFSSNAIGPAIDTGAVPAEDSSIEAVTGPSVRRKKEGYLAKKGKQFGGWKARYFVLEDRLLHYFEAPHVGQLGTIKLTNAQIARQNGKDTEEEAEFRHAFMILEPKRRDSSSLVRHVLCAESDQERDEWVNALMQHVGTTLPLSAIPSPAQGIAPARTGSRKGKAPPDNSLQAVSYEDTVPADTPVLGTTLTNGDSPSSPTRAESLSSASSQYPPISGPVGGGPIQNVAAWGNKSMPSPTTMSKEHKKRSMFGFMSRSSEDNATPYKAGRSRSPSKQNSRPTRPVFGLPLQEAAELCAPEGIDICLPAPVYRCIEYLEAKNASSEEGIFRLSGSSTVIKGLKERFNTEGDVKLVEGPYYDVHAVASLLKLYLRELPESLLTRDLHLDFLRVLETEDKQSRIATFNVLVHRLPEPNLELLATLARFLIDIVNHSDVNLMNVRNVGIVFSPTLNIPAPLISLLLSDYDSIFAEPDVTSASAASPVLEDLAHAPQDSPMDLRSPRKQMFQELPTPGYNSVAFQSMMSPGLPRQQSDTGFTPMQPTYEARQAPQPMTQVSQEGYGSLNAALASSPTIASAKPASTTQSNNLQRTESEDSPDTPTYEELAGPPKVSNIVTTNLPAEVAAHRRGKRESALLGGSALSSSPSGISGSLEGRRKSSYQRLREMAGLRE